MALKLPDHMPELDCCVHLDDGIVRIHGIPVCQDNAPPVELVRAAEATAGRAQHLRDMLVAGDFTGGLNKATAQAAQAEHNWWHAAFRVAAAFATQRHTT